MQERCRERGVSLAVELTGVAYLCLKLYTFDGFWQLNFTITLVAQAEEFLGLSAEQIFFFSSIIKISILIGYSISI